MSNQPEWAVRYHDDEEQVFPSIDEQHARDTAAEFNDTVPGPAWAEPVRKVGDQWKAVQS